MADDPQSSGGLLGMFSRPYDPAAAYGGLLSDPATKDAMQARALASMAGAFGRGAMPVPYRGGIPFLATLGQAGEAAYGGEDALIKARLVEAQTRQAQVQADVATQNMQWGKAYIKNRLGGDIGADGSATPGGAAPAAGTPAALTGTDQGPQGVASAPALPTDAQPVPFDRRQSGTEYLGSLIPAAAKYALPPGYTVEMTSGSRPGATVAGTGGPSQHASDNAADFVIKDAQGKPIDNKGPDATGYYTSLALTARKLADPDMRPWLAWGGNFTTGGDNAPKDLMHFDLAGDRGRYGTLAAMEQAHQSSLNAPPPTPPGSPPTAPAGPPQSLLAQNLPDVPPSGNLGAPGAGPAGPASGGLLAPQGAPPPPAAPPGAGAALPPGAGGPPGVTPISTGGGPQAPPTPPPPMPGRLGGVADALRGPPSGLLGPGGPPIVPASGPGGPPGPAAGPNLMPGGGASLPPPSPVGPPAGLLEQQLRLPQAPPGAPPPGPPPGAAPPMPGGPPAGAGPPPGLLMPPGSGAPPPPPLQAAPTPAPGPVPGAPTPQEIRNAKIQEALLTAMGRPVPADVTDKLKYGTAVAQAQAVAAATAAGQQPAIQANAAQEARVKAQYDLWVKQNEPQVLRPGGMVRDPQTGALTYNPATVKTTNAADGSTHEWLMYPSPTPGGVPRYQYIGQSGIGPGATQTLAQTAKAQPVQVGNQVTQEGPGYTQPIQTKAGSIIPPANTATPISGPPDYLADRAKDYAKTESEWGKSVAPAAQAIQRMDAIMTAMKSYQTGTWATDISKIVGGLKTVGINLPNANDPAEAQIILKNNFGAALDAMKSTGLSRWTQAELFGQTQNLANPDLWPKANQAIGGQVIGTLQWEQQMIKDYREAKQYAPTMDPQDFQQRWAEVNPVQGYVESATAGIGQLKGMPAPQALPPGVPEGSTATGRTYGGKPSYMVPDGRGGMKEQVLH